MTHHVPIYKRLPALAVSLLALSLLTGCGQATPPLPAPLTQTPAPAAPAAQPPVAQPAKPELVPPLTGGLARVTVKTFGLYVSPAHSPVSPERFTGYHAGVDFETYPNEKDTAVSVMAICTGKLLVKEWATGYGGVAVQACTLEGKAITVVYGHLKLASIAAKVGETLNAGTSWAELGKGYNTETDGERKHLHLGIHRGATINIRGYVQKSTDLSQWLDAMQYLK